MEIGNRHKVRWRGSQGCGRRAASNGLARLLNNLEPCFCYRHKKSDQKDRFFLSQGIWMTKNRPEVHWLHTG